jgi:hypothetical protein
MSEKMKHLVSVLAILAVFSGNQAWSQHSRSPRIQDLVARSQPLPTDQPAAVPDPAYAPLPGVGTASPAPGVGAAAPAPMASPGYAPGGAPADLATTPGVDPLSGSTGEQHTQWEQYQPPDYNDGLTSVGPCCERCGRGVNCPDIWTIDNRATVWARSKPRGITTTGIGQYVTVDGTTQFQAGAIAGTRSAAFDIAAGWRASIRRYWRPGQNNKDIYLEGVYFGFNNWSEDRGFNATEKFLVDLGGGFTGRFGNLFTPFTDPEAGPLSGIGGFDRADSHSFVYSSEIHNAEFNIRVAGRPRPDRIVLHPNGRWRRECQPGIYSTMIFGVRYFTLDESFAFRGTGLAEVYDFNGNLVESATSTGTYDIAAWNEMIGLQFGLDIEYRHCLWGWGAEAKVAPSINFAGQHSYVRSNALAQGDPFTAVDLNEFRYSDEDDVALLGDVSVYGYYKLHPNLTLRASWDMTFLVGVAMAAEQILWVRDPSPRVNNNGYQYHQGISLGLIWTR